MRLPGVITRNFRLKVLCTLLAMVTWAGVVYAANPPQTRVFTVHVPQDVASIPAKFVLVRPVTDITVLISGTRDHLDAFDERSLRLDVGYQTLSHPGLQSLPIKVTETDPNVELSSAPGSVQVDVDVLDSATIPVLVVIKKPPPFGYVVTSQGVDPATVTVTGAHTQLAGLKAQVEPNLEVQKTNVTADLPVFLVDTLGNKVNDLAPFPSTVRITLTVSTTETSRASAVVPKTSGSLAAGHELVGISVEPSTVVISGPRDLLNALDSISTAVIPLTDLSGDTTVTVAIITPAGVSAVPGTVTVHLSIIALPLPSPTPAPAPTP